MTSSINSTMIEQDVRMIGTCIFGISSITQDNEKKEEQLNVFDKAYNEVIEASDKLINIINNNKVFILNVASTALGVYMGSVSKFIKAITLIGIGAAAYIIQQNELKKNQKEVEQLRQENQEQNQVIQEQNQEFEQLRQEIKKNAEAIKSQANSDNEKAKQKTEEEIRNNNIEIKENADKAVEIMQNNPYVIPKLKDSDKRIIEKHSMVPLPSTSSTMEQASVNTSFLNHHQNNYNNQSSHNRQTFGSNAFKNFVREGGGGMQTFYSKDDAQPNGNNTPRNNNKTSFKEFLKHGGGSSYIYYPRKKK